MSPLREVTGASWTVLAVALALALASALLGPRLGGALETLLVVASLVALAAAGYLFVRDLRG